MKEPRYLLFGVWQGGHNDYIIRGDNLDEMLHEAKLKLELGYTAAIHDTLTGKDYHMPLKYIDIP